MKGTLKIWLTLISLAVITMMVIGATSTTPTVIDKSTGGYRYPAPAGWVLVEAIPTTTFEREDDTIISTGYYTRGYNVDFCPITITVATLSANESAHVYVYYDVSDDDTNFTNQTIFGDTFTTATDQQTHTFYRAGNTSGLFAPYCRIRAICGFTVPADSDSVSINTRLLFRE